MWEDRVLLISGDMKNSDELFQLFKEHAIPVQLEDESSWDRYGKHAKYIPVMSIYVHEADEEKANALMAGYNDNIREELESQLYYGEEGALPQLKCPVCDELYDMDYPKCPFCKGVTDEYDEYEE